MCPNSSKQTRKPITYDDRFMIEVGLNRGDRLSTIAKTIRRSQKVVAAEIKRNWTSSPKGMLTVTTRNLCVHSSACRRIDICKKGCMQYCCRCRDWLCNSVCEDFEAEMCPRLASAPYCCNGCPSRLGTGCRYPYRFYEAKYADDLAKRRRSEARAGIDCDQEAFERAIKVLEQGLKKGQSPAHIIATSNEVPFGKSTFYRLLDGRKAGDLSKMDLPRAVRYRPRSSNRSSDKGGSIPREVLAGRTYDDFKNNIDETLKAAAVEVDTVVGRSGIDSQAILTLFFRRFRFQLFILLPEKTKECVVHALDTLDTLCGGLFNKLCPVLLCDRGSEFANVLRMENRANGTPRTQVYFCDARHPEQKGGAEKNHEELRKILPKGKTNFDALTGRDMAVCMSHVNSYCRDSLDWWSPIAMARLVLPPNLLDAYGIEEIEPHNVNLTPYLVPHAILKR